MYCPNCGQQQVADSTRFCSRCGLALSGLGEFISGGAGLAVRQNAQTIKANSPRRKGIRRGAKVMFVSGVLAPLCFGLCFAVDNPGPLLIPLSVFLAGLFLLLYTQLFGEEIAALSSQPSQPSRISATFEGAALPPASYPVNSEGWQPVRTSELVQPSSVTEHTTKLLDKDG